MKRRVRLILASVASGMLAATVHAGPRLDSIRQRGFLICGVSPGVAGFSEVDSRGRYAGLDVDICRALSAAIFGAPDKVRYVQAPSVQGFLRVAEIDVVSRRLTWSLTRERPLGLLFGPIMFYDGQGFLVPKRRGVKSVRQLSGASICVQPGSLSEENLGPYFRAHSLELKAVSIKSTGEVPGALEAGTCHAYTADVSELGSIRSKMPNAANFDILPEQISKEPLAQLVRQDDAAFFDILRWTVFATIEAEERGVASTNVDEMLKSNDPDIRRLLGVTPGNGKALGLDERWAYNVIKTVGNYGEMFERNVGSRSAIKLTRGLNRLWTAGGLLYAPPLR